MAPQMGTMAAPQAEGTEVVPQAQTGPALQAQGIRVAPWVGGIRAIPQMQDTGLAPQWALQVEGTGAVPQAGGTGAVPQAGETGVVPRMQGTDVAPQAYDNTEKLSSLNLLKENSVSSIQSTSGARCWIFHIKYTSSFQ